MCAANISRRISSVLYFLCFLSVVNAGELEILLNLKTSLLKSNSEVFNSWLSTNSVCNFSGITCNQNGFVEEIELSKKRLSGIIHFDSICQLEHLGKLSLGMNLLNGILPPNCLNNCTKLKYLDLSNNFFSGQVPNLSNMNNLETLFLNNTGFNGAFPALKNMKNLVVLSLGDNPFDKTKFPVEILDFYKLKWVYLSNCSIEGEIPAGIGNLTELINLELSDNFLSGTIPPEISKLKNLWQLELYNNGLIGKLPIGLGNLTKLEYFDASANFLEGDLSEIRFLTNLVSLQLFENAFTGEIPVELGEFKRLVNLSLYTNKLTGALPLKLGSWADFEFIDVSENSLSGQIPPEMCNNGKMFGLLMLQNKFSGQVPVNYASCTSLTRFRVSNNSLTGAIPDGIWGLPNLNIIDVALNQFEGSITSDIENAKSLGQLFAGYNKLSGELVPEITKAVKLVAIELNNNQFSGHIPMTIGELKQLSNLHLENNKFSGNIPNSIGYCTSLSDLSIANNSLSGKIPSTLGLLPSLNSLDLSENELSGEIPPSLSSLRLSLLDLSYNKLSGRIPQSLSIEAYNGSFAGNHGLCSQTINSFRQCSSDSGMSHYLRAVILILCFVSVSIALLILLALFFTLKKSQKQHERSLKEDSWDVKSFHILTFTEDQILDSIKQENLIGKGGSGNVYRVSLPTGTDLAVKHIWNSFGTGSGASNRSSTPILDRKGSKRSPEFDAEVQTLSSIRHMNVVKLYCSITSEDSSLLVYEYMTNGSLWDRLHTCNKLELDWDTRYEIAVGAAKGLEYLHHGCERAVIHRDVKSSNILLDEFLKPRIADFGLAKIVQASTSGKDSTHVIAGTHGYIAPEYGYTYKVNEKSDVYSFGVVLMELVTGKKPMEPEYGESKDIVNWVCGMVKTKESVLNVVDKTIPKAYKEEAIKVLKIAILCTAKIPALRPTMRSVVQMLEEAQPSRLLSIVISKDGDGKA